MIEMIFFFEKVGLLLQGQGVIDNRYTMSGSKETRVDSYPRHRHLHKKT